MTSWTSGYVADIDYVFGYYSELSPQRVKLALLNSGVVYPEIEVACELGFGQGLSTNIHAAATTVKWYGTDFNPAQVGFAKELALKSGADIKLYDEAFADFCKRSDLPDFDFIGLHGIWTWISDENRHHIVDFIRRKLKVGGVVYVSYNTLPGWAGFAPIRHLMKRHLDVLGAEGAGMINRISGALEFAEDLMKVNPVYSSGNPAVRDRLTKIKSQNPHYLAHEYFNQDWHPMYFATMAEWLEPAKLAFACSSHLIDSIDNINLTSEQQAFLKNIPDPVLRESVRDFIVNQGFRRDLWIKGVRRLNGIERSETLLRLPVVLLLNRADTTLKITTALGEADMSAEFYDPVLDQLADNKPRTIGKIMSELKGSKVDLAKLIQAIMVLSSSGQIAVANDDYLVERLKKQTDKLNDYLINRARGSAEIGSLASPVTGSAVAVGRFHQLFILAMKQGKSGPQDIARFTWSILNLQNQKIIKDGKTLESDAENLDELTTRAHEFVQKRVPVLKALQVI